MRELFGLSEAVGKLRNVKADRTGVVIVFEWGDVHAECNTMTREYACAIFSKAVGEQVGVLNLPDSDGPTLRLRRSEVAQET
jgi:hypothetical protein